MFKDQIKYHDELFSGSSWGLGTMYWYIQKANTEMENRCEIKRKDSEPLSPTEYTDFGNEVYEKDIIHWWIFNKETEIEELKKKLKVH